MQQIQTRGMMLIMSSPSGAGKTTISRRILDEDARISLSLSMTTRPPRPGEQEGVHYMFRDVDTFKKMVSENGFLEWAQVFENYYGTPRVPVEQALANGKDVMFDIDWQGHRLVRAAAPEDVVSIFILPPTLAALKKRLIERGQDSAEIIDKRMQKNHDEITHWDEYDYVVVNENIEQAIAEVKAILMAERKRRARQIGLPDFVRAMLR
jgi:guanylate kinase